MKKHYCPVCLKPQPIAWCQKHGSFYSVDNRTAKTQPGTLTRSETAKLLKENRGKLRKRTAKTAKKKPVARATGLDKEPSKAQKSVDMSRLLPHGKGVFVQWSIPNSAWQVMWQPEGAKSRADIQVFGVFNSWWETADYLRRFL